MQFVAEQGDDAGVRARSGWPMGLMAGVASR